MAGLIAPVARLIEEFSKLPGVGTKEDIIEKTVVKVSGLKLRTKTFAFPGIEPAVERINEAIAPYRRFVQSTQQELTDARGALVATEDSLLRLRADIEQP